MKVITIFEENHGFIGIATTQKAAWRFILEENWFSAYDDVWDRSTLEFIPVCHVIGKDYKDITDDELIEWLLENVDEKYATCFEFGCKEIWEVE
jgi:hypothetical protein